MPSDQTPTSIIDEKFTVFLSHPTEDAQIARTLRDVLTELDRTRVDVFVDQIEIPKGKSIGSYIMSSLDKTSWFIAIGTDAIRSNFSWCGLELGYFTRVRQQRPDSHIASLFHSKIHELFMEYNNVKIVPLEEKHKAELLGTPSKITQTPLFKLFKDIAQSYIKYYNISPEEIFRQGAYFDEWAASATQRVTETYFESLRERVKHVWYPQNRIEIKIMNGNFWEGELACIPDTSEVILDTTTFSVFKLNPPGVQAGYPMPWSEFSDIVMTQCGGGHLLQIIFEILRSVMPMGSDALNDYTFLAPNGSRYRVLLVKHQRYGNNVRDFVLNLIPTLGRNAGGDRQTTVLTVGIVLASRYRFMFLERGGRYSKEQFSKQMGAADLKLLVKQMLRDIDRVNLDAADDGLNDQSELARLFADPEAINEMFKEWWGAMEELKEHAHNFLSADSADTDRIVAAHGAFVDATAPVNFRFLSMCLDAYRKFISG